MLSVLNHKSFLNLEDADNSIYCYVNGLKIAMSIASVSASFTNDNENDRD